jgi:YD repeat-containing protein
VLSRPGLTYDQRGRKASSIDPDLDTWTYTYDALDEVLTQIDAKGQITYFTYDQLGRMTKRVEQDMTSQWTYETAPMGIGRLASAGVTNQNGAVLQRLSYDAWGKTRLPNGADGQSSASDSVPNGRKLQISLYFSLLSGNLGRRPVRYGLRRQPRSLSVISILRRQDTSLECCFHVASFCKKFPSNFKAHHLVSAAPRDMNATWRGTLHGSYSPFSDCCSY